MSTESMVNVHWVHGKSPGSPLSPWTFYRRVSAWNLSFIMNASCLQFLLTCKCKCEKNFTIKILKIQTPKTFAVITLKLEQDGKICLICHCTICPDLSVRKQDHYSNWARDAALKRKAQLMCSSQINVWSFLSKYAKSCIELSYGWWWWWWLWHIWLT